MRYRPEIDGLRAIAVTSVVLFHIDVNIFSGGFIGVDIFFVISGYLITSVIKTEVEQKRFSLVGFWERRARRILPPLIFMACVCIVFSIILLTPVDFKNFSQSLAALATFSSNILFWTQTGYFAAPAEVKPLLHTWTLAVEEQFYLLFPIFFLLACRYLKGALIWILVAGASISFSVSVWGVTHEPIATFYLIPTRAWELLIGASLAFGVVTPPATKPVSTVAAAIGVVAIVLPIYLYSPNTPFPGLAALPPCIGAALIIYSNQNQRNFVYNMLAFEPFRLVGLISYSWYLWHWPAIIIVTYYLDRNVTSLEGVVVVLVSFILACFSFNFIETPVRRRKILAKRQHLFGVLLGSLAMVGAVGLYGHLNDGLPWRVSPVVQAYAEGANDLNPRRGECHGMAPKQVLRHELCKMGFADDAVPSFLVWGDSHGDAMMPAFEKLAQLTGVTGWHATYTACPPLLGVYLLNRPPTHKCQEFNAAMLSIVRDLGIENVVLIARWSFYVHGGEPGGFDRVRDVFMGVDGMEARTTQENAEVFKVGLADTVRALTDAGATVWIVKQVPLQDALPPNSLAKAAMFGRQINKIGRPVSEHRRRQALVESNFDAVKDENAKLLDPAEKLCNSLGHCIVEADQKSLYRDDDHLSTFGALWIKDVFQPIFADDSSSSS